MKNIGKRVLLSLVCVFPSVGVLFAADRFTRNLGAVVGAVGSSFGLSDSDLETYRAVMDQLQTADIQLPVILILLCFYAACFVTFSVFCKKQNRTPAKIILAIVLWMVCAAGLFLAAWAFSTVNSIRVVTVLRSLLSLL